VAWAEALAMVVALAMAVAWCFDKVVAMALIDTGAIAHSQFAKLDCSRLLHLSLDFAPQVHLPRKNYALKH